ncbi:MAG: RNA-binding protein [Elusimicrobiota bacterium]
MGKRLYVGSLPFSTTEEELRSLFSACGNVESAKVIMDRYTGRSKGFGFVEMIDENGAQQAISKMNGAEVGTRKIMVSEAKPLENRAASGDGGSRGGYGADRGYSGSGNRY